jgi:hypothetical protein
MKAVAVAVVLGSIVLAVLLIIAGFVAGGIWGPGHRALDADAVESGETMGPGMITGPGWEDPPSGPAQDLPCAEVCPIPGEAGGRP